MLSVADPSHVINVIVCICWRVNYRTMVIFGFLKPFVFDNLEQLRLIIVSILASRVDSLISCLLLDKVLELALLQEPLLVV